MPAMFYNNAISLLAQPLTISATTLTLPTGHGARFPVPSGGAWFTLTLQNGDVIEVMACTARNGDVLTVLRAQESTAASAFPAGTPVEHRLTAGTLANFMQIDSARAPNVKVVNNPTDPEHAVNKRWFDYMATPMEGDAIRRSGIFQSPVVRADTDFAMVANGNTPELRFGGGNTVFTDRTSNIVHIALQGLSHFSIGPGGAAFRNPLAVPNPNRPDHAVNMAYADQQDTWVYNNAARAHTYLMGGVWPAGRVDPGNSKTLFTLVPAPQGAQLFKLDAFAHAFNRLAHVQTGQNAHLQIGIQLQDAAGNVHSVSESQVQFGGLDYASNGTVSHVVNLGTPCPAGWNFALYAYRVGATPVDVTMFYATGFAIV